jgi:hypothetical protein
MGVCHYPYCTAAGVVARNALLGRSLRQRRALCQQDHTCYDGGDALDFPSTPRPQDKQQGLTPLSPQPFAPGVSTQNQCVADAKDSGAIALKHLHLGHAAYTVLTLNLVALLWD